VLPADASSCRAVAVILTLSEIKGSIAMYRSPNTPDAIIHLCLLMGLLAGPPPLEAQDTDSPPPAALPAEPAPPVPKQAPIAAPAADTDPAAEEAPAAAAAETASEPTEAVAEPSEPSEAVETEGEPVETTEANAEPAAVSGPADKAEAAPAKAAPAAAPAAVVPIVVKTSDNSVSTSEIMKMLRNQQAQLDEQKQLITNLQSNYRQARGAYDAEIAGQAGLIEEQRKTMRTMQAKIDEISAFDPAQMTEEEKEFRSRLETLEESISSSRDASSTTFDAESFPGSIPIAGTASAIRIGGFVKANYIQDFDTIGSVDRFIVGSIPTDPVDQGDARAELTVSQSRLNFDLRDNTDLGTLRAFIEGDFAGDGDTFRLRHAYGQLHDILAGKTWSNFVDVEATPEDIDFEGLNGRVNVRQTQFRWFPRIGQDWNLIASLEDPTPAIRNGEGVSLIPDIIASMRRNWFDRWHVKTSLILRNIEARWDVDNSVKGDVSGWGFSVSGKTAIKRWDPKDNFMFQINYGKGYGGYVNDLATLDEGDAVFDDTGNLFALPVLAGYVAVQKWWKDNLRSTFVGSIVNVDTYSFQPDDAYKNTQRFSGNLIWSPTSRVDVGGELLWGRRQDKDKDDGTALQFQLSSKYRF